MLPLPPFHQDNLTNALLRVHKLPHSEGFAEVCSVLAATVVELERLRKEVEELKKKAA